MSLAITEPSSGPLVGKHVAFVGKLGGVTRREAARLIRDEGGIPMDRLGPEADLVVIGADELPISYGDDLLDEATRRAANEGSVEILSETQLWQLLGLVDPENHVHRLYTPAMLADLLELPIATIRRWHRRKLIVPAKEVHHLPYFDFQEVDTARHLAQLVVAGVSPQQLEKQLAELGRFVPDVERPLAQLSVIVKGKQILLRQGEGLIEPGGQMRIDFEALDEARSTRDPEILTLPAESYDADVLSAEDMLDLAVEFEDDGRLESAAELYRAALAAGGPDAEICFRLAELLYRLGDLTAARERYYIAIELKEDYVEARANLGCVLVETGQPELAIAAFQGTLQLHHDYPDVHYHLARTLDDCRRRSEARPHWETFVRLAPDSPWADEARSRLDTI